MSVISINCVDQSLEIVNSPTITAGNENEDYVEFSFCPMWSGYAKIAIFYKNKSEMHYSIIDDNNRCKIPNSMLTDEGIVCMGVVGFNNDNGTYKTRTTEVLRYNITEGILNGYGINDPTLSELFYKQVKTAVINESGHLIITLADNSTIDAGLITQLQPDWEQSDSEAPDYIKHKPEEFKPESHRHDYSDIDNAPDGIISLNKNGGRSLPYSFEEIQQMAEDGKSMTRDGYMVIYACIDEDSGHLLIYYLGVGGDDGDTVGVICEECTDTKGDNPKLVMPCVMENGQTIADIKTDLTALHNADSTISTEFYDALSTVEAKIPTSVSMVRKTTSYTLPEDASEIEIDLESLGVDGYEFTLLADILKPTSAINLTISAVTDNGTIPIFYRGLGSTAECYIDYHIEVFNLGIRGHGYWTGTYDQSGTTNLTPIQNCNTSDTATGFNKIKKLIFKASTSTLNAGTKFEFDWDEVEI